MVLGITKCNWSLFRSVVAPKAFRSERLSSSPEFPGTNVPNCEFLLSQIPLQFQCPLRVLSTVVKSPELRWAHVRWLFSTDFHMAQKSTLSNQCFPTRVWRCTTWAPPDAWARFIEETANFPTTMIPITTSQLSKIWLRKLLVD